MYYRLRLKRNLKTPSNDRRKVKNKATSVSVLLQHQRAVFYEPLEYSWNKLLLELKTTERKLRILINLSRHLSLDVLQISLFYSLSNSGYDLKSQKVII